MNKKKLVTSVVSLVIGAGIMLFSSKETVSAKSQHNNQTKTAQYSSQHLDYDTDMHRDKYGQNKVSVDYYMLALSWSPGFCEYKKKSTQGNLPRSLQYQCANPHKFGWVIHGLWPQNRSARQIDQHPRFCQGDLPPVDERIIEKYMREAPGKPLLQGEWEKHGACAFKQPQDYFNMQRALYNDLKLPNKKLNRKALFRWMRDNNPKLRNVYLGASRNELYICYNKKWQPINCPKHH
ncbi:MULTISPECIES: ribonuclease T2 family protein [Pasteurellaceae]|uniref:Ribonuclease n=1 Tax=Pasteurella atlantica TaxID=2827233 RepID=A0AAW8CRJ5_9PAST|nr:ribonuclease [Pasteurella atlantica]MBR0574132.1 ribonuclease [Pasteurella atlantica]MDP8040035.1 ribonuclease [Pasteurella atlantica]MDP8042156.1 ribonuclease [Pasteurella atlantica]MDP8044343.1 ribonuclease [Pasteurella atlantica]MDP8046416.1 ribonuclease [Pasteurella atlantica]